MSIPCPKCKRPNPIESKVCECGFVFVDDAVIFEPSSSSQFPDLQAILPDFKKPKPQLKLVNPSEISPSIASPAPPEMKPAAMALQDQPTPAIGPMFLAAEPNNGAWKYLILAVAMLLTGAIGVFVGNRTAVSDQPAGSEIRQLAGTGSANDEGSSPANENGTLQNPNEPQSGVINVQADTPETSAASTETLNARPATGKTRETEKPGDSKAGSSPDGNVGAISSTANASVAPSSETVVNSKGTDANRTAEKSPANATRPVSPVAKCGDGTFSYRKSGAGSCAQRGGVVEWLDGTPSNTKSTRETRNYFLGPKGGCYYLNTKGTKIYVDKSYCS